MEGSSSDSPGLFFYSTQPLASSFMPQAFRIVTFSAELRHDPSTCVATLENMQEGFFDPLKINHGIQLIHNVADASASKKASDSAS